jgi:spermidine synthase
VTDESPPPRRGFLYALVFCVGACALGAEIAAVRLLAPYFGASTFVWANTIGVVLVALSAGYWLGGRMADRRPELRALSQVALVAAAMLAVVPFVARPLLDAAVVALDEISAGAFIGSLLAVSVLVGIPLVLLGTVSPWAIRLAMSDVREAGTVAGRLYAISTVGSLVGTLTSALVLVPFLGTRRTFLLMALLLAVVALTGMRGRRWRLWALPALMAVAMAAPTGRIKESPDGRVIFETETPYQYARVVEDDGGVRSLELNEGQAVHSKFDPRTALTGDVWDGYLLAPFAVWRRAPRRVAILGNAAGTTARAYDRFFPTTAVDGVEIDGELSDVGRRYFGMPTRNLRVYDEDARPFLRRIDRRYDGIFVDAYRQPYIPFYLTTREFFELTARRLAPGGVVVVNVGHPEGEDELERVLGRTMQSVFRHVLRDPTEPTNTLLVGARVPPVVPAPGEPVPGLPAALRGLADEEFAQLGPRLPGGEVYTDDRAPVEWLIDRSIISYATE